MTDENGRMAAFDRRGVTLMEALVVVGIILLLSTLVLFSGRMLRESRNGAIARQQLELIADAIEQYASFWPRWEAGGVVIADRGWPDFVPGRLFGSCGGGVGPYETIAGFNDFVDLGGVAWIDDPIFVLNANTCLAFGLTASSGKGPYIRDPEGANLVDGAKFVFDAGRILYPPFDSGCSALAGGSKPAELFVDPWGTPLRYFWVYRDTDRTSFKGYLPVRYGAFTVGAGFGGVDDPLFFQTVGGLRQKAVGYVLESAGPNRKFGNVWKTGPTNQEIQDAADNIVVTP